MRFRITLATAAVTTLVVIAFSVPLALVVRVIAQDRALDAGQLEARSLAVLVASISDRASLTHALEDFGDEPRTVTVFLPDGTVLGQPVVAPDEVALARQGRGFLAHAPRGDRAVFLPVRHSSGQISVIRVGVPHRELVRGVTRAWLAIAGLGLAIIAASLAVADWLARSMARPIGDLEATARRLREGEMDARVEPSGPGEVVAVGEALNELADRIDHMLVAERETAADLSHRLRTPLTALRLEVDGLRSGTARDRVWRAVTEVEAAVDRLIVDARSPRVQPSRADLGRIVVDRLAFWAVLAEDQGRELTLDVAAGDHPVRVAPDELEASVDALVNNVFAHTEEGTAFRVGVEKDDGHHLLIVEDDGVGLPAAVPRRGGSEHSTGLGLDIVRTTAERSGGSLNVGTSVSGGARVVVRFGAVIPEATSDQTPAPADR